MKPPMKPPPGGKAKYWRKLSAADYAALFPAKPKALRKIAFGLRHLGAKGLEGSGDGWGNEVFTLNEDQLAEFCDVGTRTLQRYLQVFESYGIIEVKRWRYLNTGALANSYRLYLGSVIPEGWTFGGGDYPISLAQRPAKADEGS